MPRQPIKIVQILSSSLGGAADHVLNLVNSTTEPGITHYLVIPPDGGHIIRDFTDAGYTVETMNVARGFSLKTFFKLVRFLKKTDPHIVHCHGYRAGLYGRPAARLASLKIKTILTVHGFHYMHYRNKLKGFIFLTIERLFSVFTDLVIAVSDTDLKNLRRYKNACEEKSVAIFNGIDAEAIISLDIDRSAKKRELGIPEGAEYIIGTVARLRPEKGVLYFLRAIPVVLQRYPNAYFLVAGDGEQRKEFEDLVQEFSIANRVGFLGNRDDVPEILKVLDIFVFPSLWEGLPIAPLEAMVAGVPVVATDVSGNKDVIGYDNENGLLVPPEAPEAIAEAVIRLLADKSLANKLAASALQRVRENFMVWQMAGKTIKIYRQLLGEQL
ncbi:glycosyltransferase family 4 protein [Candidatus Margulisiibacteriota bacterium]